MTTQTRSVRILYVGGPLNRRWGYTTDPANYRDTQGLELSHERGIGLIHAYARLGATAPMYVLDPNQHTYHWLGDLLAEMRTYRESRK